MSDRADLSIRERAERAGVSPSYTSFWGEPKEAGDEILDRILQAMGDSTPVEPSLVIRGDRRLDVEAGDSWRLVRLEDGVTVANGQGPRAEVDSLEPGYYLLHSGGAERFVIAAPDACWVPDALVQGERWWGVTVQLYSLRGANDWGIGDFGALRELVTVAAAQGASFVGLSPLHALHAHRPELASPYSPSSRLALNTLFIDVTGLPEYALSAQAQARVADSTFQQRLQAVRESELVRYEDVAALKAEVLQLLWTHFRAHELERGTPRGRAFETFMAEHELTLGRHALFEAIQLHLRASDPSVWGWPAWPEHLKDPQGEGVKAFARDHAEQVRWRYWLQWIANEQVARVQKHATSVMPLGLYCDLAVGSSEGGSETWGQGSMYARGLNVGAPSDALNALGQDWGLPPINPLALERARFAPFIALLRSSMRHAGAVRLDHVMALMRLFWTSYGQGTYVRYPLEASMAVLAVESHRHRCAVIGEDLGNVAPAMRAAMKSGAVLSYRPLVFEREDGGGFRPPLQWESRALAVASTHDLPTLMGYWSGRDVEVQAQLGQLPSPESHGERVIERAQDRARLLIALEHEQLLPEGMSVHASAAEDISPAFAAAIHAFLARTPCWLAAAQLEDMTGQLEQANVPGTSEEQHPNWRRRMALPISTLPANALFTSIAAAMRQERGRPSGVAAPQELPGLETADIPRATYRVQLHSRCTFEQVTWAVDYLDALGVSHLYCSPYLKARPGSTHGYDVIDPTQINPEIGDEASHAALCDALREKGMGQVLDIVPNHMGVLEADNPFWQDVLEHGKASAHAQTFDIEWQPAAPEMHGRVLLPILGDHYGKVLEAGEFQLRFDAEAGAFRVHYWDHCAPIDPQHYPRILGALPPPAEGLASEAGTVSHVQSLLDAFARLAGRDESDETLRAARLRDAALHKQSLAVLAREHAWVRDWIAACLQVINGNKDDPSSFDALDALLRSQAFRLADWRVAGDDINYRRFFDINALAAVRMEHPGVFEATHGRVLRWLAEGKVTGLRIDHPDGLSDPAAYFEQLQQRYAALAIASGEEPRALYLAVEKIRAEHESLPADWRVHGGTGYRFATLVNGLYVATRTQADFDAVYESFTGDVQPFEATVHECKKHIIDSALSSELGWLAETLYRITRADRRACDFTRNRLRAALGEVAAAFPVYRTYVKPSQPTSEGDLRHIDWAIAAARRRMGSTEAGLLTYLRDILAGEPGPMQDQRERFVTRWQQFTAPVMAKAVEDTAFYRYVRLASLNDVGSEPRRFGISNAAFHASNVQAFRYKPHGLLASSTHDSKRSEDVRARLNVLSEMPARWEDAVLHLGEASEGFRQEVDGQLAPSRLDQWAFFQAIAGIWPADGASPDERIDLLARAKQYMCKAVREAKRETNSLSPNEAYESALANYIERSIRSEAFVRVLESFVADVAPAGFANGLSQLALKLTVPGVPDIYQGCEKWCFSLVDPDNRRPVDFDRLRSTLEPLMSLYDRRMPRQSEWQELLANIDDGRIKQLVTWRLLQLRKQLPELFKSGTYLPLEVQGPASDHAVAFARVREGKAVIVIAARLLHGLASRGWEDTSLTLAGAHPTVERAVTWEDWMTGTRIDAAALLKLQGLVGDASPASTALPFAVLVAAEAP